MNRTLVGVVALALAGASAAWAIEGQGVLKGVDPDAGTITINLGGQDRTVKVAKDLKVHDASGKELADGLKSKELKPGAAIHVTAERGDGGPVVTALRLGGSGAGAGRPAGKGDAPPKTDTSKLMALTDMGEAEYQGFKGGLYPDGKNERPAAHEAAGLALAKQVQPLDADGKPDPAGKIVLLGVGMSNTSQAFGAFIQAADRDGGKNPRVVLVNGAQGGMTAQIIQDPENGRGATHWQVVDDRLKAAGVTRAQVQAIWIKEADAGPTQGFPGYAKKLQEELGKIVQLFPKRFPNCRLVYLSSRTYGGFAKSRLNPEPYAFESGFSVKWLIEQQLKGEPAFNFDAAKGAIGAPWLSWGPYLWANGGTKRSDGFSFEEGDFAADGTHESPAGQRKVADLMLKFFKSDSTTKGWFAAK